MSNLNLLLKRKTNFVPVSFVLKAYACKFWLAKKGDTILKRKNTNGLKITSTKDEGSYIQKSWFVQTNSKKD